ncbi:hypothetical protein RF11_14157 [Thelohanellus kitauei]|uniref:Uncharacterized protein n=1 Tax=Thelohanellus kitauei TaxID=669202 RepID=A0A0C2MJS2_THEKT|nr:hypothetical protein RF11_14157 [Thelohanellus kitauei]
MLRSYSRRFPYLFFDIGLGSVRTCTCAFLSEFYFEHDIDVVNIRLSHAESNSGKAPHCLHSFRITPPPPPFPLPSRAEVPSSNRSLGMAMQTGFEYLHTPVKCAFLYGPEAVDLTRVDSILSSYYRS